MIRRVRADGSVERGGSFVRVLRRDVVNRVRAAARSRVALIVAPAGYGKSTALSQFLATQREPYIRFDMRAEHATIFGFLRGFAQACAEIAPAMRTTLDDAFEGSRSSPDPNADLARWLGTHLRDYTGLIAIDDLHVCSAVNEISALLASLVERASREVRFLFASRSFMKFPLASWLAYGVCDFAVDEHDLRFSLEDLRNMADAMHLKVRDEELMRLLEMTNGWATALAFAVRTSTRSADLEAASATTRELIFAYIAEQVEASLDEADRELLTFAALLPEVQIELLEAAGFPDAAMRIELLSLRASPFVGDTSQRPLEFHDQFREFFLRRLEESGEARAAALRVRAAEVLEEADLVKAALPLFVRAKSAATVRRLLAQRGLELIEAGEAENVLDAISSLDASPFASDPILMALRGWCLLRAGDVVPGERLMRTAIGRGLEGELRGRVMLQCAIVRINLGEDASGLLVSLIDESADASDIRAEAIALRAVLAARTGEADLARGLIFSTLASAQSVESDILRAKLFLRAGIAASALGEYGSALEPLTRAADCAASAGVVSLCSRAHATLASLASLLQRDASLQLQHARLAAEFALQSGNTFELQIATLHELHVAVRRGEDEEITRLERRLADCAYPDSRWNAHRLVARAQMLAWSGCFDEAHRILAPVCEAVSEVEDRLWQLACCALFRAVEGREEEALRYIERANHLFDDAAARRASPAGIELPVAALVIAYISMGKANRGARLVTQIERRTGALARSLRDMLDGFLALSKTGFCLSAEGSEAIDRLVALDYAGSARLFRAVAQRLQERERRDDVPLTMRELDILRGLVSGLSPKEIA